MVENRRWQKALLHCNAGFVIEHLKRFPLEGEVFDLPTLRIEVTRVERGPVRRYAPSPNEIERSLD